MRTSPSTGWGSGEAPAVVRIGVRFAPVRQPIVLVVHQLDQRQRLSAGGHHWESVDGTRASCVPYERT